MITKIPTAIRTSELRKNLSRYIKESAKNPVVISTDRGSDSRVLIGSDLYNALVDAYNDREDKNDLEQLLAKDDGKRVSLSSLRKKYDV